MRCASSATAPSVSWTGSTRSGPPSPSSSKAQLIADELLYRELFDRYGDYFTGAMGAEAIQKLLGDYDVDAESDILRETIRSGKGQKKLRALKRLKVVAAFQATRNNPQGMVLDCVPVIPPDLRPMVQLDGGRFATSDLNDLYRRVINRNNRLKRLIDLGAPEIIVNNEKRMLQEAVDALFDNGRRGRPVTGPGNRPLKSLSDLLKGKQGRFRQNLLGKRVDYSGRSVIVVGPQLKLHQCGLPKQMALELFKPFVMKRLVDLNHAQNIKSAKRMVERARPAVWDVLEEVITEHPVLLNRAPTLHRLGIQAFEPQLVEGKAIQLHPLVCEAFNADFDGDQMAVHLPLSAEAQAEARVLMLSSNNILSPASGKPLAMPRLDMVTGLYHLTRLKEGDARRGSLVLVARRGPDGVRPQGPRPAGDGQDPRLRQEPAQGPGARRLGARSAVAREDHAGSRAVQRDPAAGLRLHQRGHAQEAAGRDHQRPGRAVPDGHRRPDAGQAEGRRFPLGHPFRCHRRDLGRARARREAGHPRGARAASRTRSRSATSAVSSPHDERNNELVKVWTKATEEVAEVMEDNFPDDNSIRVIVKSGAAGNMTQVRSLAGMRGLVTNPKGEYIPRPIKTSFREGLSVLEYFIATHGARKGLADTALRTADSGYLTRRLVDVSQDVIIREVDCGTTRGVQMTVGEQLGDKVGMHEFAQTSVYARTVADDITDADGNLVLNRGDDLGDPALVTLVEAGIVRVKVRSVLTCESPVGVCASCYGRSMATGQLVDVGEAVGIVAAQSIGEPGTQLTMRTFHQGGVAGDDITTGLPRVQELFEARVPKGKAPIADVDGRVRIEDGDRFWKITLIPDDGSEEIVFEKLSKRQRLANTATGPLQDGDHVSVGQQLLEGTPDPHEVLRVMGPREAQLHLVDEVQKVYRAQGVAIHDKHIEVIVRQMLRRVTIIDSGADRVPARLAGRAGGLRVGQPRGRRRGWRAGRRSSGADGYHEGLAGDGLVAVGGVLPGDHSCADRRGHQRAFGQAHRSEGERDHR